MGELFLAHLVEMQKGEITGIFAQVEEEAETGSSDRKRSPLSV